MNLLPRNIKFLLSDTFQILQYVTLSFSTINSSAVYVIRHSFKWTEGKFYFLQTFSEKNLSTELMSYVTTMFNPSVAVKLQRSKKDYNFQILDQKLDSTLARLNTNLPDLLQTISMKYRFNRKIKNFHFQLS